MPDADIVVGGFPCQVFSLTNRLGTLEDDRNRLYKFFYNTIKIKQPKFFIGENVKGILSLGKGEAIKQIVADFEAAGYITSVNLVNMANYGVPQTRQRVIIIGQRKNLGESLLLKFPEPAHAKDGKNGLPIWVTIKNAIDHFPDVENCVLNHVYSAYISSKPIELSQVSPTGLRALRHNKYHNGGNLGCRSYQAVQVQRRGYCCEWICNENGYSHVI